jgi:2-(3-amino-3-carboxypropyl)histidine synthase
LGIWLVGEEQFGGKSDGSCCGCDNGDAKGLEEDYGGEYSMDYYAQDGGEWNSSYVKKATRPVRRNVVSSIGNVAAT